jgi:hypothetical protein
MKKKTIIIPILLMLSIILHIVLLRDHYVDKEFKDIEKNIAYSKQLNEYCERVAYMRYDTYLKYDKYSNKKSN